MTEIHDQDTPDRVNGDEVRALDAAWRRFEGALVRYLGLMVQSRERNSIVLELAGPVLGAGATGRYLQLDSDGSDKLLHATACGNQPLAPIHRMDDDECTALRRHGWNGNDETGSDWTTERPVAELTELAADCIWLLRHCHHVVHPHLLTYRIDGPVALATAPLGLRATADVPVEARATIRFAQAGEPDDGPPIPIVTTTTEDLVSLVEAAVEQGAAIHVDFVLYVDRQPVFVRVSDDQASVRLSSRVVRQVSSPSEARTDIRIFNRAGEWLDWHVARRDIWVSGTVATAPFDEAAFGERVEQFLDTLRSHRHALARRTGGRTY